MIMMWFSNAAELLQSVDHSRVVKNSQETLWYSLRIAVCERLLHRLC